MVVDWLADKNRILTLILLNFNGKLLQIITKSSADMMISAGNFFGAHCSHDEGTVVVAESYTLAKATAATIFELCNMCHTEAFRQIAREAQSGQLSREEYGLRVELVEFLSCEMYTTVATQAKANNPKFFADVNWLSWAKNIETVLEINSKNGHAECYRRRWDHRYEGVYNKERLRKMSEELSKAPRSHFVESPVQWSHLSPTSNQSPILALAKEELPRDATESAPINPQADSQPQEVELHPEESSLSEEEESPLPDSIEPEPINPQADSQPQEEELSSENVVELDERGEDAPSEVSSLSALEEEESTSSAAIELDSSSQSQPTRVDPEYRQISQPLEYLAAPDAAAKPELPSIAPCELSSVNPNSSIEITAGMSAIEQPVPKQYPHRINHLCELVKGDKIRISEAGTLTDVEGTFQSFNCYCINVIDLNGKAVQLEREEFSIFSIRVVASFIGAPSLASTLSVPSVREVYDLHELKAGDQITFYTRHRKVPLQGTFERLDMYMVHLIDSSGERDSADRKDLLPGVTVTC